MRLVGKTLATMTIAAAIGVGSLVAQDTAPLTGQWAVEIIGGVGVGADSRAALTFAADGAVSGSGGCNRLMGRAGISGQTIKFGPLATTRMACSAAVMAMERKLLDAFTATRSYHIAGSLLTLHDASGVELVRLARRP
jgi:heat shock protein HslJ